MRALGNSPEGDPIDTLVKLAEAEAGLLKYVELYGVMPYMGLEAEAMQCPKSQSARRVSKRASRLTF
jgi:hypothetical protein